MWVLHEELDLPKPNVFIMNCERFYIIVLMFWRYSFSVHVFCGENVEVSHVCRLVGGGGGDQVRSMSKKLLYNLTELLKLAVSGRLGLYLMSTPITNRIHQISD